MMAGVMVIIIIGILFTVSPILGICLAIGFGLPIAWHVVDGLVKERR